MAKPDKPITFKPKSGMTPREAAAQDEEQTRRDIHRGEEREQPARQAGEEQRGPGKGGEPPTRR